MRIYRLWAGSPNGTKEDVTKCIASVPDGRRSVLNHQCSRKRGYGPCKEYCKSHAKQIDKRGYR